MSTKRGEVIQKLKRMRSMGMPAEVMSEVLSNLDYESIVNVALTSKDSAIHEALAWTFKVKLQQEYGINWNKCEKGYGKENLCTPQQAYKHFYYASKRQDAATGKSFSEDNPHHFSQEQQQVFLSKSISFDKETGPLKDAFATWYLEMACDAGNVVLVKNLNEKTGIKFTQRMLNGAIDSGSLPLVKFVASKIPFDKNTIPRARKSGNVKMVEFLVNAEKIRSKKKPEEVIIESTKKFKLSLNILKWMNKAFKSMSKKVKERKMRSGKSETIKVLDQDIPYAQCLMEQLQPGVSLTPTVYTKALAMLKKITKAVESGDLVNTKYWVNQLKHFQRFNFKPSEELLADAFSRSENQGLSKAPVRISSKISMIKYLVELGVNRTVSLTGNVASDDLPRIKDFMKYLKDKGIQFDSKPLLSSAARFGRRDVVEFLVKRENMDLSKASYHLLKNALNSGNIRLVKYLVEKDQTKKGQIEIPNSKMRCQRLLAGAIQSKNIKVVEYFLKKLEALGKAGKLGKLGKLEKQEFHLDNRVLDGMFIEAAKSGNLKILECIVGKFKLGESPDKESLRTALNSSTKSGKRDIVDYLIKYVEGKNTTPNPVFFTNAVFSGDSKLVEHLLETFKPPQNVLKAMLKMAIECDDSTSVDLLVKEQKIELPQSALTMAVEKSNVTIIKCLIKDGGMKPNESDIKTAEKSGHSALAKFLKDSLPSSKKSLEESPEMRM